MVQNNLLTAFALDMALVTAALDGNPAKEYIYVASMGTPDRNGNVYDIAGWKLDNYHKNPVVMAQHRWADLPLGTARVWIDTDKLMAAVTFADSPEADKYRNMVDQGILRGISVGNVPLTFDIRRDPQTGWPIGIHSHSQELVELSMVSIPAMPEALRVASLSATDPDAQDILAALREQRTR